MSEHKQKLINRTCLTCEKKPQTCCVRMNLIGSCWSCKKLTWCLSFLLPQLMC